MILLIQSIQWNLGWRGCRESVSVVVFSLMKKQKPDDNLAWSFVSQDWAILIISSLYYFIHNTVWFHSSNQCKSLYMTHHAEGSKYGYYT